MNKETDAEPRPKELYDFLYRDIERIASYYAQIWNGRLLSVEETVTENQKSEETQKADAQIASFESKAISEYVSSNKRTVDMHDAATVDLLLRLAAQGAERGVLGSIQVVSGTCFFLDRNILKYAGPAIDMISRQQPSPASNKSRPERRREMRESAKLSAEGRTDFSVIKDFIKSIEMPSGFVLKISDDISVCGSLKESGLDQPISSLLFRAGSLGLAQTFVVGLIENLGITGNIVSPIHEAQTQMAQSFFPLLFPPDAIRMIPLAIYRKIPI